MQQMTQHPGAPFDRAAFDPIAAHRMDRRHSQQAAPRCIGRHGNRTKALTVHAVDAIVGRQQPVDDDVVTLELSPEPSVLWIVKDRTVNGTFASGAPARNSRNVGIGSLLRASRGLTRLVNGRRR